MSSKSFRFVSFLFLFLLLVFSLHLGILYVFDKPLWEQGIVLSYGVNFIMAVLVLLLVERSLKRESSHTGFLLMGGSALKFLIFFLVFYPLYNEDGQMTTTEFVAFFVPYGLCLALEVYHLSKALNNQQTPPNSSP